MKNNFLINGERITGQRVLAKIRTIFKEHYNENNIEVIQIVFNDITDFFQVKSRGF